MIVGTAGHVDHGKTTLVRALTGVDTDRLKEEKARGITIDLGFAYMPGPGGDGSEPIGFIDVPGHERLVRTMVAGAAGIDYALLVVAADDGIMPQTREHLDILRLLGLRRGAVVVTKCDRVDAARRSGVAAEIAAALAGTGMGETLRGPLFVSAATGEGIGALREQLLAEAGSGEADRRDDRLFRMGVDRSFNLPGIGTVATGTALDGTVAVGDEVTVMPGGHRARVRSLHAQNREAARGRAGERCALALSGAAITRDVLGRGTWICGGAAPRQTARFDADLRLLGHEARPLADWTPLHLHCGASDVPARAVNLGEGSLPPGGEGIVQLVLDAALPLRHGDLFVLRDGSGQRTLGGGRVLDPRAPLRKRRSPERLARLAALRPADPADALRRLLDLAPGFEPLDGFGADRGLADPQALAGRTGLVLLRAGDERYAHAPSRWASLAQEVEERLALFHAEHPDLPGLAGERLRAGLALPKPLFAAVREKLLAEKRLAAQGHWLRLPGHVAELAADDHRIAERIVPLIAADRFRPPRVRDFVRDLGRDVAAAEPGVRRACKALARTGRLVEIAHDHFFLRSTVMEMAGIAANLTRASDTGVFSAADFRDKLDNGRKVAIQILEYFDREGLTKRDGDLRRVVRAPALVFGQDAA